MIKDDVQELINIIEKDMHNLMRGIDNNDPKLKKLIEYIKIGIPLFSIDWRYIFDLMGKYILGIKKQSSYEEILKQFLDARMELIDTIFLKDIFFNNIIYFPFNLNGSPVPNSGQLCLSLYYTIFKELILTSNKIGDIFNKLYEEWNKSFKHSKIPISLITYLPIFTQLGDYKLDNGVILKSCRPYFLLEDITLKGQNNKDYILSYFDFSDPKNSISPMRCYLIFESEVEFGLKDGFEKGGNEQKFAEQEDQIQKEFFAVINTLCLFGKDFKFDKFILVFPWWYPYGLYDFEQFKKRVYSHKIRTLDEKEIQSLINYYSEVEYSKIFLDREHDIISSRYFQIFNRDNLPDIIIDASTLLEAIFTKGSKDYVSLRLRLNASSILARNIKEFWKIYKFIRKIYSIRSRIVHGSDWKEKFEDFIRKRYWNKEEKFINADIYFRNELLLYLNSSLTYLIEIMNEDSEIFEKMNIDPLYFFNNSNLTKAGDTREEIIKRIRNNYISQKYRYDNQWEEIYDLFNIEM